MTSDAVWHFQESHREAVQEALHHSYDVRTICNVIRYLYSRCTTPEQRALCEEIIWMAKKMDTKLRTYKQDWDEGIWHHEDTLSA